MVWDPRNWRQGRIVPAKSLPEGDRLQDVSYFIVISHDCDLARSSEVEPFVELLPCHPSVLDGNLQNAKDPRRLQLGISMNGEAACCFELRATEKKSIAKEAFISEAGGVRIGDDDLQVLRTWLALRYRRQAVPDSLNDGLRPFWEKFKKPAQKLGHVLHGIWVRYEPQQEPDDSSQGYSCEFYFVYDADQDEHGLQTLELIKQLQPAAKDLGNKMPPIFLDMVPAPDTEFSYRLQRHLVRWAHDHISHKVNIPAPDA